MNELIEIVDNLIREDIYDIHITEADKLLDQASIVKIGGGDEGTVRTLTHIAAAHIYLAGDPPEKPETDVVGPFSE